MSDERLWAVRGAVGVERNDRAAILAGAEELMRTLMERNDLVPERIVSCMFTCTGDLNSEFPAVAARELGLDSVPLLCAQEMDVPGAMRGVIRVMVNYYAPVDHSPSHTYLGKTQKLRTDLHAAQ